MDHFRVDTQESTLIIACAVGTSPNVVHWGRRLDAAVSADELIALGTRQGAHGMPDICLTASLAMEPGLGLLGPPGFSAHRGGKDWGSLFRVTSAAATDTELRLFCEDPLTRLALTYLFKVDALTGTFTLRTTLINNGDDLLDLVEMATASLPIPQNMRELIGFSGRWTYEFQRDRLPRFNGTYLRENRRGRTSHDSFPALILCTPETNEASGDAYGLHLAWSGNHRLRVDTLSDGRVFASLGSLLLPGEMRLAPGEQFISPDIVASYSSRGLSALSQNFHGHVRQNVLRATTRTKPRPVHYNTWEAVYFDHDGDRLKDLATRAAAIGVERFVLDDGWFGSRRNDLAGLGDWTISDAVYPAGLTPLIDHVTGLGMEMGIWFEPEMVNPDSNLYRAHPDWVLAIPGVDQTPYRHQYVLDISRADVADYLFDHIDAILSHHDIGYIKWDMNRDLNHPGDALGFPRALAQVHALYALLDRIRAKHPHVEIESCSSGGARADFGVLAHTDRVWTSDCNDAIDRQAIQRGASYFLPLEVMGAHVGPRICHTTGRTLPMAMRAATALMGHMGLELNLLEEPEAELSELKDAIALHKRHRALLHQGLLVRLNTPDHMNGVGVIAPDQSEAIYSLALLTGQVEVLPDRVHFTGLDPERSYRIKLVWPLRWTSVISPSIVDTLDLTGAGAVITGHSLINVGMQLPLSRPETCLLFHLVAL